MRTLLRQPLYAGYIDSAQYGLSWVKAQHEALISLDTYQRIQDRRAGVAKAPKRANIGDEFALRGVAVCASCEAPLRSSFSRGRHGKRFPYYTCHTKTCDHYGKSIRRDKLEGDVAALIKQLEPAPALMDLAKAMFRQAWQSREFQAKGAQSDLKEQLASIERDMAKTLDRLMNAGNDAVVRAYETKIADLEKSKRLIEDRLASGAPSRGTYEEHIEPVLQFLANPWKLWETGQVEMRRLVLKLAFAGRIKYCRFEGPRTPDIALPFKAIAGGEAICVGGGGRPWNRTRHGSPRRSYSPLPHLAARRPT